MYYWEVSSLAILSRKNSSIFKGASKKISIVSNNICFGPCPKPTDEVEQHILLNDKGKVEFSSYSYGDGTY